MTRKMIEAGIAVLMQEPVLSLERDRLEEIATSVYMAMQRADEGEAESEPSMHAKQK